jgi:hypothetical protein
VVAPDGYLIAVNVINLLPAVLILLVSHIGPGFSENALHDLPLVPHIEPGFSQNALHDSPLVSQIA